MTYRPTPWDVLELEWCPRYLWLSKRHGVPVTRSMAQGKREEAALRARAIATLGGEPRSVYVDAGWTHGVVDMLIKRAAATPVELKWGIPRREHKWQLLAEAYLARAGLKLAVYRGYLIYPRHAKSLEITPSDLKAAERLLWKAAEVVEGPPPPARRSGKCSYCQYRNICTGT